MAMIERGVRLVGRHDLGGAPNGGEGMAMKIASDGRRLLYVANDSAPQAMCILDVTKPERPELLWQLPTPHAKVRGNSLAVRGSTLLLAWQTQEKGDTPAGFTIFDIADPAAPRELAFFDTSGPGSVGVHFVSTMDERYAHIATGAPGYTPIRGKDHQLYMCVDISDRRHPREVGRWWIPGLVATDGVDGPTIHEGIYDHGFRTHNTLCYPQRPDRAYVAYLDGGVCILDIADPTRPTLVSRLDYHPPAPGFTHTIVPLFERDLLVVSDECTNEETADRGKSVWIVDMSDERAPRIVAKMAEPEDADALLARVGRIGPHNLHENEAEPGAAHLLRTVVSCWFGAGVRVFDIADPAAPREIAWFIPDAPQGQRAPRMNDVFADDRGYIYAVDRKGGGLYVLKWDGKVPLS